MGERGAQRPLLLQGGLVLVDASAQAVRADVLVVDGRIVAVGSDLPQAADPTVERLDASEHLIMPGLVNAHTHGHNALTHGFADRWTLEDLLNHGPVLLSGRTEREQYLSAALNAAEMLRSGCTSAYDLFMALPVPTAAGCAAVAQAYIDSGMRAVLAPAVADVVFYRTVPGLLDLLPAEERATVEALQPAATEGLLTMCDAHVRQWDDAAGGRIRAAVAPTIPGQCSDDFLLGAARIAREHGVGFHTHLAESKVQMIWAQQRWGTTIVEHLCDLGLLDAQFVGAHAIWLTEGDMRTLADCGCGVAHNPASNLRLGSGIAPVRELLDAGVTVGLGSDGSTSSDNQNLFTALQLAATLGNVRAQHAHDTSRWIGADEAFALATTGGARLLGQLDGAGRIAPGAVADLVLLRADSMYLRPLHDAVRALVYVETGASVDTVLVGGRVVVQGGVLTTLDEPALRREAQAFAERLLAQRDAQGSSAQAAWQMARMLAPYLAQACSAAVAQPFPVNRYAGAV